MLGGFLLSLRNSESSISTPILVPDTPKERNDGCFLKKYSQFLGVKHTESRNYYSLLLGYFGYNSLRKPALGTL